MVRWAYTIFKYYKPLIILQQISVAHGAPVCIKKHLPTVTLILTRPMSANFQLFITYLSILLSETLL